jgi:hypothetical protein
VTHEARSALPSHSILLFLKMRVNEYVLTNITSMEEGRFGLLNFFCGLKLAVLCSIGNKVGREMIEA